VTAVKLPETDLARIGRYCAHKVLAPARKERTVEFTMRGRSVTIIESRPPWMGAGPWDQIKIAQLRYRPETSDWTLHCRNRNQRWFDYDDLFSGTAAQLLAEIDEDPSSIFWG